MNLQKLFDAQKKLDDHIIREKGLEGEDLLDKKTLALQVELGELANEWRGFKFWSEDREPRYETVEIYVHGYDGPGQNTRASIEEYQRWPIEEEYVDCLHFLLSIGNDLKINNIIIYNNYTEETITGTFIEMFSYTSILRNSIKYFSREVIEETYKIVFNLFVGLGEMLGFTWQEVEQAYYKKNKINHERQESGY